MYFYAALASMFGWVMHATLLAKYARKLDGISISFYRSLSLAVGMLPILLLADLSKLPLILEDFYFYLFGGVIGGIAVIFYYQSQKYLPIGTVTGLDKLSVIMIALLAFFVDGEKVNVIGFSAISIILASIMCLAFTKNKMKHLSGTALEGVLIALPRILLLGVYFYVLGIFSRKVDFAISAYFMEMGVLLGIILCLPFNYMINRSTLKRINLPIFINIGLCSLFTLLGTGGYALAVSMGGAQGVVAAIAATDIIFVSILGYFFYNEKFRLKQWLFIGTAFIGLIMLRLFA